MNLRKRYQDNPCQTLSIPYWKHTLIKIPPNLVILHQDEFQGNENSFSCVKRYFRIIHYLDNVGDESAVIQTIDIKEDLFDLHKMINDCYQDDNIAVTIDVLKEYQKSAVFNRNLWVKIVIDGKMIASGIAEYDQNFKEGIIEWVQVIKEYRHKGYGKLIVNALLFRLAKIAKYVTVSGLEDSSKNPKGLYQACGFIGNDIWYICTK